MPYYDVVAKFEVEADTAEAAQMEVIGTAHNFFEDWDIRSVELSADQGDSDDSDDPAVSS